MLQIGLGVPLDRGYYLCYPTFVKMSIYVPDELWEAVRQARPEAPSPSQIVQDALSRLTHESQSQERVPADVAPEFEAARARFVREASTEFEHGYRAALAASADLDWSDVEILAEAFKFNVKEWAEAWKESAERHDLARAGVPVVLYPGDEKPDVKKVNALMKALGEWATPHGSEEWVPRQTYVKGFTQAMRTLWASVAKDVEGVTDAGEKSAAAAKGVSPESAS